MYGGTAVLVGRTASPQSAYFDHLASEFLHGRLCLRDPPGTRDLTQHDGRWYVPFPPLPAMLMLPTVAVLGGVNTVAFSIVCGAASVALVYRLLSEIARRGLLDAARGDAVWLTVLFAVGCVHWYVAVEGSVWFLAQTCAVMFAALAAWLAVRSETAWPSSIALALAMWGRPHILLTWPLLAALALDRRRGADGRVDRAAALRWMIRSAAAPAVAVLGLLAYNHARFGDWLDFGYQRQHVDTEVLADLHAHGQFSPVFIVRNLRTMLLSLPTWDAERRIPVPSDRGMSLLLTTPAFLLLLGRVWSGDGNDERPRRPVVRAAWVSVLLLLVPLMLYYNTGWRQFGYRFSLDFMIPAMVLLADAARASPRVVRGLILAGVAVNAWGVWWWFGG